MDKIKLAVQKDYFVCPNRVFDLALSATEKLVYINLICRADSNSSAWPGYGRIAADCGINRRTVINIIKQLELQGFIKKQVRPAGFGRRYYSNLYLVYLPADHQGSDLRSPGVVISDHQGSDLRSPEQYHIPVLETSSSNRADDEVINNAETIKKQLKDLGYNCSESLAAAWASAYSLDDITAAIRATNLPAARNPAAVITWQLRTKAYLKPGVGPYEKFVDTSQDIDQLQPIDAKALMGLLSK